MVMKHLLRRMHLSRAKLCGGILLEVPGGSISIYRNLKGMIELDTTGLNRVVLSSVKR